MKETIDKSKDKYEYWQNIQVINRSCQILYRESSLIPKFC